MQLALLGAGDAELEAALLSAAPNAHPGQVGVRIGYDETLAHRIQAGSDALLVPSRFEPCGLTQLCALRYGAVPGGCARRRTGRHHHRRHRDGAGVERGDRRAVRPGDERGAGPGSAENRRHCSATSGRGAGCSSTAWRPTSPGAIRRGATPRFTANWRPREHKCQCA